MRMNPKQVRELLEVSNHSLKYWRRLAPDHPLHLSATPDPDNSNLIWYDQDEVMEFVARNETYRNRVLAKLAPAEDKAALALPRAAAHQAASALRAESTQPDPAFAGWATIGLNP